MNQQQLIHCLRHGQTEANRAGRFNDGDDPLTDAQRAALRRIEFDWRQYDVIYVSPLRRAVETAECLGIITWIREPRIVERDFGIFAGLTPLECEHRFPEEFEAFCAIDADYVVPEGESRAQNLARILDWVQDQSAYRTVLAITHGGTIDFLYRLGTGLPPHGGDGIYAGTNASLSTFEVEWPDLRLVSFSVALDA